MAVDAERGPEGAAVYQRLADSGEHTAAVHAAGQLEAVLACHDRADRATPPT